MRSRRALADEYAQSKCARARLFQSLNFTQPNQRRELITIACNRIGGSSTRLHRPRHYVGSDFF